MDAAYPSSHLFCFVVCVLSWAMLCLRHQSSLHQSMPARLHQQSVRLHQLKNQSRQQLHRLHPRQARRQVLHQRQRPLLCQLRQYSSLHSHQRNNLRQRQASMAIRGGITLIRQAGVLFIPLCRTSVVLGISRVSARSGHPPMAMLLSVAMESIHIQAESGALAQKTVEYRRYCIHIEERALVMNNYPNGPYPPQQPSYPQGQSPMQQPPVQQKPKKINIIKMVLLAAIIVVAVLLCVFFGGWH